MSRLTCLVMTGLLLLNTSGEALGRPLLRAAISESWAAPLVVPNNAPAPGIVVDIYQRLAQELDHDLRFLTVPRNRINDLSAAGAADLHCSTNPAWVSDPRLYQWLPSLFEYSDVITAREGAARINTLETLTGKRLQTVLGYHYPTLAPWFQDKLLIREDVSNESKVLFNVSQGIADYGVIRSLNLDYFNLHAADTSSARLTPIFEVSHYEFLCAVPNAGRVNPAQLRDAVVRLREAGVFTAILERYR